MVKLKIDGKEVQIEKGATILAAAEQVGIKIPTLCFLKKVSPTGACRICVVDIAGVDKPMTACNTVAVDGMVVTTQSEKSAVHPPPGGRTAAGQPSPRLSGLRCRRRVRPAERLLCPRCRPPALRGGRRQSRRHQPLAADPAGPQPLHPLREMRQGLPRGGRLQRPLRQRQGRHGVHRQASRTLRILRQLCPGLPDRDDDLQDLSNSRPAPGSCARSPRSAPPAAATARSISTSSRTRSTGSPPKMGRRSTTATSASAVSSGPAISAPRSA